MPEGGASALVALGSYAREELCPGSDVDLLLVHDGREGVGETADAVWYPLWDAGLTVGHAARTVKEAVAVADGDVEVLTSMLDGRHVAGDRELTASLLGAVRDLAGKRRARLVEALATASEERRGALIGDLLEPDLKAGGGGLRDLQSLVWAGWTLGEPGGLEVLSERGYLQEGDTETLGEARELLLTVRVAVHRVARGKGDELLLQDQDAVAAWVGRGDADELARRLAVSSRTVSWIAADVWQRLRSAARGPLGRLVRRDREIAEGVILRDGRVSLASGAGSDVGTVLRLAAAAARHGHPLDRSTLARLAEGAGRPGWEPRWVAGARDDLLALLGRGRVAIELVESLDHAGLWAALLPEWEHVRSLPQRNAYHRFTVDRHLLEAVAECVALVEGETVEEGEIALDVAGRLDRPELLVLAALLHDVGKGLDGDHSEVGTELAVSVCDRIGLDEEGCSRVATAVRHHLVLPDVATRRDLSEEATVAGVARLAGDVETLELLYLLTIGDSRATGPAAWGPVKAALVRELFLEARHLLERGEVGSGFAEARRRELAELLGAEPARAFLDAMPPSYPGPYSAEEMVRHRELLDAGAVAVEWGTGIEGRPVCTVVAPDRSGMLVAVAGVLSSHGLDVQEAGVHTRDDGAALEVIRVHDTYGRLARPGTPERITDDLRGAVEGDFDVSTWVEERRRRYQPVRRRTKPPRAPEVVVDQDASDFATVVEVHADDRVGLLFQIAGVLADFGLDVHLAKVNTVGDRVVDAFYVRDASGGKLADPAVVDRLRATLLGRLQRV